MINNEIERRFLIRRPDTDKLTLCRKYDIVQTYLIKGNNDNRRVRRITENGKTNYTYTVKRFISPITREEDEREIGEDEYRLLLKQEDKELRPVNKTRNVLEYEGRFFEIDCYSFSDKYAVMEIELESEDAVFKLPDNIEVLKEVTGDREYSNAVIAKKAMFPEEKD